MEQNFNFGFSMDKFKKLIKNPDEELWYEKLYEILPKYEINTLKRVSYFLAQTCHESSDFNILKENMNYSAEGLSKTFPKRFPTIKSAQHLHRQPEKIANNIYSNRMGNGDEKSGEGWKYIGKGILQVTGKSNYTECSTFLFNDDTLVKNPELLFSSKEHAILSACWFWQKHKLNSFCDKDDIMGMTKIINGGINGLEDRKKRFELYYKILIGE